MRALLVAGARPNFMKVAPLLHELERRGVSCVLVHTGQHYDHELAGAVLESLGLRAPDVHLGVGSASHAVQTARLLEALEPVLLRERPDWVVTVGDVNSTLAAALVAAKLRPELGCLLAHVEAGLRSGDWSMPEEVNRVLTDRLSDLLFTTERDAAANLAAEGIAPERIVFAGNVMIDTLLANLERARSYADGVPAGDYVVVTLHRPSNVDDAERLGAILDALARLSARARVILPMHPRTRARVAEFGFEDRVASLDVRPPADYLGMLALVDGARAVLTDSGGLQEETTVLGVPCLTLRENTERPITLTLGTNRMVPLPMTSDGILEAALERVGTARATVGSRAPEGWDGRAAQRIADALLERA